MEDDAGKRRGNPVIESIGCRIAVDALYADAGGVTLGYMTRWIPMTTAATRLFLVRHGATQLTAEDEFSGSVGVDLSEEGRRQAGCLAERLAHETITAV